MSPHPTRRESLTAAVVTAALSLGLLVACHTVPITGRRQLILLPERQEISMGATAYQEVLKEEPLSDNTQYNALVQRVGKRIAAVTGEKGYQWAFKVIKDDTPNAFCLPGGKVAFYEGILPACQTEAGIAVVMGHEVAHAIARHGGERMSRQVLVQAGAVGLDIATQDKSAQKRTILLGAYGGLAQVGLILPFSRKHESEADEMGIIYMAKAGYDPAEAKRFWQRFGQSTGGKSPPEFLSTHPSHNTRAGDLAALEKEAMALYKKAPHQYGQGEAVGAGGGGSGTKNTNTSTETSGGKPGETTREGGRKGPKGK